MTRIEANLYLDNGELKPLTKVETPPKVVYVRFTEEEWALIEKDMDFWFARGAIERTSAARYLRFAVASIHDATEAQMDMQKIAEQLELDNAIERLKAVDADSTEKTADSDIEEDVQEDVQEQDEQDDEKED